MSEWTPERQSRLEALAAAGMSASAIAGRLSGVTRNAVIGRARRTGVKLKGPRFLAPSQLQQIALRSWSDPDVRKRRTDAIKRGWANRKLRLTARKSQKKRCLAETQHDEFSVA